MSWRRAFSCSNARGDDARNEEGPNTEHAVGRPLESLVMPPH